MPPTTIRPQPADILSFRHMLVSALHEFLGIEQMDFDGAAAGMGEVLVGLSRYREEGALLYPSLFLCEDLASMLDCLGGCDMLAIGRGPRDPSTFQRALKQCAPLCRSGWSIYLVRQAEWLDFGVFRTDSFFLCRTAMGRLREVCDPHVRIVGVVQLGENILELRGSSGARRLIFLSGAPTDALPAIALIRDLARVATRHVPDTLSGKVTIFLQRVFVDAMRASHGSLIAVLPRGMSPAEVFTDVIVLDRPIRVPELVRTFEEIGSAESRASVEGAGHLLEGMLGVDGITVLASDGSIVGYNAFLHFGSGVSPPVAALGGARRRTFNALAAMVGHSLVGAFVRSQDGFADCRVSEEDPLSSTR